jgi:predicted TIM-barrel fold metal-dependent hydrolase
MLLLFAYTVSHVFRLPKVATTLLSGAKGVQKTSLRQSRHYRHRFTQVLGIPFSLPALCIPAAQKYPGLKIVLAHAGADRFR